MSFRFRRVVGVVVAVAGLLLALPSAAGAATSKYPPGAAARGFGSGPAGWSASSSFDGACLPPALCPTATNTVETSGGADGGGFIRSAFTGAAGATAVAGTTTAVWQSPTFAYDGAGGQAPTAVGFEMDRRADVDQLLAVAGNSATYAVQLVDVTAGGETVTLISPATLAGANSWRNVPRATIDSGALAIGHSYRIRVVSTYVTGTSAFVTGSADYDNVVLSAIRGRRGAGADGLSRKRLTQLVRAASPGTAKLKGRRLFVRVKCPRKLRRACRITVQGLLRKRRPATTRRTVKLRRGKAKRVVLRVKPKARRKVAKRKRLLIRQKVRVGRITVTVHKKRRLIRG